MEVAIAATLLSSAVGMKASADAGRTANKEAQIAANREGDAARAREIERRRALLRSLASQSAQAGAYGVTPDAAIAGTDIRYATNDLLIDQANTLTEQNLLRARGKNAQRAGNIGAVTSLLDGIGSAASLYKPKV